MAPAKHEIRAPETGLCAATTKAGVFASQKPTLALKEPMTKVIGRICHKIYNSIFYKVSPRNL